MKYDLDNLEPLYELEVGKPGSSFAFEIAQKIGLPNAIIQNSRNKVGKSHVDYDQLLNRLEQEKSNFEKQNRSLEKNQKELQKARKDYEDLRKMLEVEKKHIVKQAKNEAKLIIDGANKDVERVIREIQENKASKAVTKNLRSELASKKEKLGSDKSEKKAGNIKVADQVKMVGQDTVGVVKKLNGKQAEVLFGSLKSIVSVDKLEKALGGQKQKERERKVKKMGIDISSKMATFSHELSIRGLRADEALGKVESFVDEALLLGVDEIRVLHGKGHGILRDIVRNFAKDHSAIANVEDEHADRGGAGISIIKLR